MLVPIDWQFRGDSWGRPEIALPAYENVGFNLSNTKELVAGAVALEGGIGVDVETLDRAGDLLEFASRFMAEPEMAAIRGLLPDEQAHRRFIYSTLKEAYIKARRMGLPIPLNKFWFQQDSESPSPLPGWCSA